MRHSPERRLQLALTFLFLAGLSCSVFGSGGSPAPVDLGQAASAVPSQAPPATEAACGDIRLDQEAGTPGDLISVKGIAAGIDLSTAFASPDADGEGPAVPVIQTEDGPTLVVPVHPDGIQGGELSLTIWVGSQRCGDVSLTVEPMQPEQGALVQYVDLLQEYLDLERTLAGVTRDELLAGADAPLPANLMPLGFTQQLVDGPDYPDSLRAIADGTAPVTDLPGYDIGVLDALVGQLGLIDQVQSEIEIDRELMNESAAAAVRHMASPAPQAIIGNIRNAAELDTAMRRQASCEAQGEGATGKLLHDATVAGRKVAGGLANLIPGWGRAAAKAAIFAARLPTLTCKYLLPSSFTTMTADGSILWFPDEWAGGPGAVIQTTVVAASKELNLMKEVNQFTLGMEDEARKEEIRQLADDLCAQFEGCKQGKPILGPLEYGPIDVTGPTWTEAEAINNVVSVAQAYGVYTYAPEEIGTGGVHIMTADGHFGDASPAQTDLDVRVADCVDTGINPPEGTYAFSQPDSPLTCTTPRGTGQVTSHGGSYSADLSWLDAYACQISVHVGPVQYLAARTLATESVSVYQGVVVEGDTTCGVTMSWDDASQGFLGELRCWAGGGGSFCTGTSDFSMDP